MKIENERRRHKRFKYEAHVSHDVSANDSIHTGKMFNFCKGGLYFESDQYICPGEDIFVGLAIHDWTPAGAPGQLDAVTRVSQLEQLEVNRVHWPRA